MFNGWKEILIFLVAPSKDNIRWEEKVKAGSVWVIQLSQEKASLNLFTFVIDLTNILLHIRFFLVGGMYLSLQIVFFLHTHHSFLVLPATALSGWHKGLHVLNLTRFVCLKIRIISIWIHFSTFFLVKYSGILISHVGWNSSLITIM